MANVVTSSCKIALMANLVPGDIFKDKGNYYLLLDYVDRDGCRIYRGADLSNGLCKDFSSKDYVKVVNELHIIPMKKFIERLHK